MGFRAWSFITALCLLAALLTQPSTLHAQSTAANQVLDLDGTGDYVRLPPAGFTNFHQATIEAWVKWRSLFLYPRLFDFGARRREMYVHAGPEPGVLNSSSLRFMIVDTTGTRRRVDVYGAVRLNEWSHIAVVTGTGGVRLYLNGMLVATNEFAGSLSSLGVENYYLGCANYTRIPSEFLQGQLDEVRVWSVMRTEEEIRANQFRRLTGHESGLAGLWNFDDPAQPGRDATTNGFHGQLFGDARSVPTELPSPAALPSPSLVEGRVTDFEGALIPGAQICIAPAQYFKDRANMAAPAWASFGRTDNDGRYRLVGFAPSETAALGGYALDGELSGMRTNLTLLPGQRQEVDLELQGTLVMAGKVVAMDNVPLAAVQLGLAKPRSSPAEAPQFVGSLTSTRDNGEFRFQGTRPAGRYDLLALTQRGPVSLLEGQMIDFDPQKPLTNLMFQLAPMKKGRWRSFSPAEGLPNNRVNCLLPEADGAIWVGTSEGLARFDGQEFVPWEVPASLQNLSVFDVRYDPQGVLWACTSGGMARFDGREWTLRYSSQDGLPDNTPALATDWDTTGRMWVGSARGLFRREGERFVEVPSADGRSLWQITDLLVEPNGTMWIAAGGRGPFRWDGQELRPLPAASGSDVSQARSVYRDGEGQILFSTQGGVLRWDAATTNLVDAGIGEAEGPLHRDAQGTWWTGGRRGLQRRAADSTVVYQKTDGLASDVVRALASDDRGALWVGTDGGLSRFEEEGLQVLSTRDGLPRNVVTRVVIAPDGSVWFTCPQNDSANSSPEDILCRYDGRLVRRYGREQGLGARIIGGLHVDADGTVWAGAGGSSRSRGWVLSPVTGVWRSEGNRFVPLDTSAGLSDLRVGAIQRAANGQLWVGSEQLAKLFDGRSSQVVSVPGQVLTALSSPNGDMWVGTVGGALRWNERLLTAWTSTDFLTSSVLGIAVATNGVTWFGTSRGLFRSENPDSPPVPWVKRGLLSGNVWSLLFDNDGLLWIGTDNGVARFDGAAWSWLGESDGLPGKVVYAIQQAADGAMWLGTDGGLVRYARNKTMPTKPAVTVRTDGVFGELAKMPSLWQGRWATFRFATVDASTPAARRQYRIELKSDEPGATNLVSIQSEPQFDWRPEKSGHYTASVRYLDGELNYSEPVLAQLTVVAPWYRNAFIMAPLLIANLGLLGWAFVARIMVIRRKREAEQLREQLLEQERHAREALEAKAAQLAESNTQLVSAKEVAESARQTAETANAAKSIFLANMSHEIRTPMNAILGYSQILKRDQELPTKYRQPIQTIEQSGDHLLAMINDILDLSKIEAGRMELQPSDFDLTALIQGIKAMFKVRCEEKKLKLEIEGPSTPLRAGLGDSPCPVHGDEGKLRQVLINLLGNAVKFTERGSVTLRVGPKTVDSGQWTVDGGPKTEDGQTKSDIPPSTVHRPPPAHRSFSEGGSTVFAFSVTDTGKGISPENLRDLFQPFQQGAEGRMKGGTGLGLAITKRQVELMGGTIGVESTPGKGTCFYFHLPLPAARGEVTAPKAKDERHVVGLAAGCSVRALVVDDVRANREVLLQMLNGVGCDVRIAEGGEQALGALRTELPDVVFMDIRMPDLEGPEVADRIFAEFGRGRMKLVAISASVLAHEQKSYLDAGFDAFVGKPFRFEEICACLRNLLNVEFRYAEEPEQAAPALALDPRTVQLPAELLGQLREAANRYSVTKLEQGLTELENDGENGKRVAAYCRGLIQRGDLETIAEFLQEVKGE